MLHSEVFMREDLAAILRALAVTAAVASAGAQAPHAAAYRRGFAAALAAIATALHVRPEELRGDLAAQPTLR